MITRTLRFLFPMVLLLGIGLVIYWFWTGKFFERTNNIEISTITQKFRNVVDEKKENKKPLPTLKINNKIFKVEVVSTPKERQKGLMHREVLPDDQGMLFVFDRSDIYGFWMPNVNFPLDIVWLKEDFTVVDIKTVPPCKEKVIQNCRSYEPDGAAKYVLEVNANLFSGVIGDRVEVEW